MKRALIFVLALLPASAMGAPSGIAWTNGKRLDAAALQQFDNLKANQSAADALQASKLNRSGDTSTNQTLNGSTINMGAVNGTAVGAGTYTAAASGLSRTINSRLNDAVYVADFGAKCNGTDDDDDAISNALAALKPGEHLVFPAGTCRYHTPQHLPIVQSVALSGAGARQTTLLYTGTSTTSDLWTIGDGTTSMTGWSITGLRFDSATKMTAGTALRMRRMQNGNQLVDVDAGAISQSAKNLWGGIWLDNVNVFKYDHFNIQVQNEGLMMNGAVGSDEGSDIFLDDGVITYSAVGYHVGGGMGGVYFGRVLAFGNGVNYQVDNLLAAQRNRELFFSISAVSDGSYSHGIWINDTLTSNAPITINGALGSAGTMGSGIGHEVYIQHWPNGRVSFGAGQLYNATGDGLRVDDASTVVTIDAGRQIFKNGGYGVNATVPTTNIYSAAQYLALNASGNYSANVLTPSVVSTPLLGTVLTHTKQDVDKSYVYAGPSSGGTVTMVAGQQTAVISPASGLATLSVALPACNAGYDGSIARFGSTQAITALTVTATSGYVQSPPTTLAAGGGHGWICLGSVSAWFPLY